MARKCTPVEYMYLTYRFFAVLHTLSALMLIYCRCKSIITKLITFSRVRIVFFVVSWPFRISKYVSDESLDSLLQLYWLPLQALVSRPTCYTSFHVLETGCRFVFVTDITVLLHNLLISSLNMSIVLLFSNSSLCLCTLLLVIVELDIPVCYKICK